MRAKANFEVAVIGPGRPGRETHFGIYFWMLIFVIHIKPLSGQL
jgi:hypothetical protein